MITMILTKKNYCLKGRRKNNRYQLGDKVKVKVARANLERKQLDFALVDERHHLKNEDEMGIRLQWQKLCIKGKNPIQGEKEDE